MEKKKRTIHSSDYGPMSIPVVYDEARSSYYIAERTLRHFTNLDEKAFAGKVNGADYLYVETKRKDAYGISEWYVSTLDAYLLLGLEHPFAKWLHEEETLHLPRRRGSTEADNETLRTAARRRTSLSRLVSVYGKAAREKSGSTRNIPYNTIRELRESLEQLVEKLDRVGVVRHNSMIVREAFELIKEAKRIDGNGPSESRKEPTS